MQNAVSGFDPENASITDMTIHKLPLFHKLIATALLLFLLPFALNAAGPVLKKEFDFKGDTRTLALSEVLPKEFLDEILADTSYTIDRKVINNGAFNRYEIDSEYGKSTAYSTEQLLLRIEQIKACKTIDEINEGKVYGGAVLQSATAPLFVAKEIVKNPVTGLSNIGKGAWQMGANIHYAATSDDPYQENVAKTAIGHQQSKRELAYHLNVNPYTTWEPLQERLSDIAWYSTGGGLTVSAATMAVGGVAGSVVGNSQTADGMARLAVRLPPEELQDINDEKLKAMGVVESMRKTFLTNYIYDPVKATRLVGALDAMKAVKNRDGFIVHRAALAESQTQAILNRELAEMLESYHRTIEPVKQIIMSHSIPFMKKADGSLVAVLPTDYVTWTELTSGTMDIVTQTLKENGHKIEGSALWFKGYVSPNAKKGIEALGWTVKTKTGKLLTAEEKEAQKKPKEDVFPKEKPALDGPAEVQE